MLPSTKGWFPANWMKSTLPMLEDPGLTTGDLQGSSFLLRYGKVNYLITAKHVIEELRDPMIGYHRTNQMLERISCKDFESKMRLKWIYHPNGLDIAAIPFPVKKFHDVEIIEEQYWINSSTVRIGETVVHLGYPYGQASQYIDKTPSFFAIAMPGSILSATIDGIITKTSGAPGASGGPLFMKQNGTYPTLIGIVVSVKVKNGQYLDKTTSIPIRQILPMLESEKMKEQVGAYEKLIIDILDNDEKTSSNQN